MKRSIVIFRNFVFLLLLITLSCNKKEDKNINVLQTKKNVATEFAPEQKQELKSFADDENLSSDSKTLKINKLSEVNNAPTSTAQYAPKIRKSAIIVFDCQNWNNSKLKVDSILDKYKGFYARETIDKDSYSDYYELIINLPSENFDKFIRETENVVKSLKSKTITKEDVSSTYIDLETKLNTKKKSILAYQDLLKKAKSMKEIINIQEKIDELENEIDNTGKQFDYLSHSIDYGYVNLKLYQHANNEIPGIKKFTFLDQLVDSLKTGLDAVIALFFWLLSIWPLIILIIVFYPVIRRIILKAKAKEQEKRVNNILQV